MNREVDDRFPRVVPLARATKGNFVKKRSSIVQALWMIAEAIVLNNSLVPSSGIKVRLLRLFGAQIGTGCVCPHAFRVKYPWNLRIGDDCWIGDGVWLYNQGMIEIGSNVCISQRSFLSTGSHDWEGDMSLRIDPIIIEDGAWISSMCFVQKGVTGGRGSIVTPMSVVHKSIGPFSIVGGNPAKFIRWRASDAPMGGSPSAQQGSS